MDRTLVYDAPLSQWVAKEGLEIAEYFKRIGGTHPQIGIDRNFAEN